MNPRKKKNAGKKSRALKHFLLPVDFSIPSRSAFQAALSLAALEENDLMESARRHLKQFRETAMDPGLEVGTLMRSGSPSRQIVEAARARKVDLIVMASHGYSGIKRIWLGSTAERVIREAPCAVLVAK